MFIFFSGFFFLKTSKSHICILVGTVNCIDGNWESCLFLSFITMKRCHDRSNAYKGKQLTGAGYDCFVCLHHDRKHGVAEGVRQDFYIQISRQQEKRLSHWAWLEFLNPKAYPSGTFSPKCPHRLHRSPYSNPFKWCHSYAPMGTISIKLP